ncbi:molybdenum ABC transporter permease subunit [Streptomyces agglomeratus]|uniref:Molybdenum ABC transporter permease subunit n=1 Tax=Streptomyces agglomeratus TaxID=285458 RepID=A0A1E5PFW9_9ACTN|nr:ABC transporter permease [Streptomyces agglomeratus]OEJ28448.1 molybdenum ABC transporter permease subunit [Streptomyces agglomeratus]OEJ57361.1 molybdenum ABC transporter permease subunit [Streptomyces agglomeratus]
MKRLRSRAAGPRTPVLLGIPALLAVAFLLLPLIGVLVRTQWNDLADHLSRPGTTEALRLSLVVSLWALGLSLLLGVPLAWLLARVPFPGKAFVRSLVLLPMVLPPTVGGVALLLAFGRRGLLGPWLENTFGITLPFHTSGAVLAATFVAMPFLVISLEGALGGLRPRYEETAASLGASPVRVFFTVTLPMVAPGLVAGAALTWARALGEFGATITFAGNLPGTTQTLPLQVYLLLQDEPEAATSVSLLLLAIAMLVLVALRGRWTGAPAARARESGPAADEPEPAAADVGAAAGPAGPRENWALHAEVTGFNRLTLDAAPGTTIAVVGPNGAGKTTLLRALLGLTPRAHATLRLGDTDVTRLPPHRRGVAWVPQDGALFPHLSALANTAYGLRAHGVPRAEARRGAQEWLDRLGVGHLAHRKPAEVSGGQAQRVALARALATRPRLLLLDEPLAALDQTTRAHVRHTLRNHLAGFGGVCLIVTHDPVEAVSLADRVLVLDDGRALQDAPPAEVTRHPRSPWVARMLGRNAWPGTATANGLQLAGGETLVVAEPLPAGTDALAIIAPEAVSVHRDKPTGSPRNVWPGTVREITASGSRLRVLITSDRAPDLVAEITPQAAAELRLGDGTSVWTSVKATETTVVAL